MNFSNDHVLTLKGHIVLEADNADVGTINGVAFKNGNIYTPASVEANNFTAHSDKRLKKNVKDIENPLELVDKLRGVTFNWNADDNCSSPEYGFIAQEVRQNFPSLVSQGSTSGILSVDYMKVVSILCSAVQDLSKQVESLKSKLH